VKKGEKGIAILAPCKGRAKEAAETTDGDETSGRSPMYFRVVYVFDVSQTEGEPLPAVTKILDGGDVAAADAAFERLREFSERSLNVPVTIEPITNGAAGYISRLERKIVVGDHLPPVQRAKTLAHEIAHAVLHLDSKDSHERPVMEVEAESTAFVVLDALGFDTSAYSFGYVAGWADAGQDAAAAAATNAADAVTKAGANITRAAQAILAGRFDVNDEGDDDDDTVAAAAPVAAPVAAAETASAA